MSTGSISAPSRGTYSAGLGVAAVEACVCACFFLLEALGCPKYCMTADWVMLARGVDSSMGRRETRLQPQGNQMLFRGPPRTLRHRGCRWIPRSRFAWCDNDQRTVNRQAMGDGRCRTLWVLLNGTTISFVTRKRGRRTTFRRKSLTSRSDAWLMLLAGCCLAGSNPLAVSSSIQSTLSSKIWETWKKSAMTICKKRQCSKRRTCQHHSRHVLPN